MAESQLTTTFRRYCSDINNNGIGWWNEVILTNLLGTFAGEKTKTATVSTLTTLKVDSQQKSDDDSESVEKLYWGFKGTRRSQHQTLMSRCLRSARDRQ